MREINKKEMEMVGGGFDFSSVINSEGAKNVRSAFSNIRKELPGLISGFFGAITRGIQKRWQANPTLSGFFKGFSRAR